MIFRIALLATFAVIGSALAQNASTATVQSLTLQNGSISARLLPEPGGMRAELGDGVVQHFAPASITGAAQAATFTSAASALASVLPSHVQFIVDPALPATMGSVPAAGWQVDRSGNISAYADPLGTVFGHGYGQAQLVAGGTGGLPVVRNNSVTNVNSGYDALVFPASALASGGIADQMFSASGEAYYCAAVVKPTGGGGNELFRAFSSTGTHVNLLSTGSASGTLRIEQNNGAATGSEAATNALIGNPGALEWGTDGATNYVFRNGIATVQTMADASHIGGFNVGGTASMELLNNSKTDISLILCAAGFPSRASRGTLLTALASRYGLAAISAPTVGPTAAVAASKPDTTTTFLTTPNFPLASPLPTIAGATPGNGVMLASGATQAFSLVMGKATPGANMTTGQSVRDRFFMNYALGNLNSTFGSPVDTGQSNNNTFAAVARHYAVGDPNDLHLMAADGLHLRAICSQNRTNCSPGQVWGAMIRLPYAFHPGMVLKVTYKAPAGNHSWTPIWMFRGEQVSPGPGGNPYQGFGTDASLYRGVHNGKIIEIDANDMFSVFDRGVSPGKQLIFGEPNIYGTAWNTAPHNVYRASTQGYVFHGTGGAPFMARSADFSAGFHTMLLNWRGDGSNLIDVIEDGKTVQTDYMEYPADFYTGADHTTHDLGMHLIIGNQAIASFTAGHNVVTDNDGIIDGWTIVVQEITAWVGKIANPDALRPN